MNNKSDLTEYLKMIEEFFLSGSLIRIVIHPRTKVDWEKIKVRPIFVQQEMKLQATYQYPKKDVVKNFTIHEFRSFIDELYLNFRLKTLFWETTTQTYQMEISKKGKVFVSTKEIEVSIKEVDLQHNRIKSYLLPSDVPFLQDLGIASSLGKIMADGQRKYRQINKYIEILDKMIDEHSPQKPLHIIDMGSGLGYLTFSLYYYLTTIRGRDIQVKGVELREELVDKCNKIAQKYGFSGLIFESGDISKMKDEPIDILIALHACDIATDMAIAAGVRNGAQLIILAPCCHKQVRQSMRSTPIQEAITKHGILLERQAEILTDTIRGLLLEAHGYQTKIFEFISPEHTSKNLMITAVKSTPNQAAFDVVQEIKSNFGIEKHYLEDILPLNKVTSPF
jgi:protein-L-isoaspartate O-methyltransferase